MFSAQLIAALLVSIPLASAVEDSWASYIGISSKPVLSKIHILMFETDATKLQEENSSLDFFMKTSEAAGIETTIFGEGLAFTGFGEKYAHVRDVVKNVGDDTLVIVSDSRDVLLNVPGTDLSRDIVSNFIATYQRLTKSSPNAVVMSAESQCCVSAMSHACPSDYFDPITGGRNVRACNSVAESCPSQDGENIDLWKSFMSELAYRKTGTHHNSAYLNAGLIAGPARNIVELIDRIDIDVDEDDQAVMSGLLYHDPDSIILDYQQELFGTAEWPKGLEDGCVFFENKEHILVHSETRASPLIIHTPGKFFGCLDRLIEKVGGVSQKRYLERQLQAPNYPSLKPTNAPGQSPSKVPTRKPPTKTPTRRPTAAPTRKPPTKSPTKTPTRRRTAAPTRKPTRKI